MKQIRMPAGARHKSSDLNQTAQGTPPASEELAVPKETAFWREPAAELLRELHATLDGLTSAEARQRLGRIRQITVRSANSFAEPTTEGLDTNRARKHRIC